MHARELLMRLRDELTTKHHLQQLRGSLKWQDILELSEQRVELIDLQPARRKEGTLPLLLVPGFSGNAEVVRTHAQELVARGRRTLCVNAPHGVDCSASEEHLRTLPFPQLRKAIALLGALEKKELTQVDAIGYSEAALTMTIAAKLQPTQFRTIVIMNPAGLTGRHTIPGLVLRFTFDKILEGWNALVRSFHERSDVQRKFRILWEKSCSVLSDPLRSAQEIRAISEAQIHEWLRDLQETHGIRVVVIQSAGDRVFPRARMEQFITAAHIPPQHVFFEELTGTHDIVLARPEHAMEIADRALTAVEAE